MHRSATAGRLDLVSARNLALVRTKSMSRITRSQSSSAYQKARSLAELSLSCPSHDKERERAGTKQERALVVHIGPRRRLPMMSPDETNFKNFN